MSPSFTKKANEKVYELATFTERLLKLSSCTKSVSLGMLRKIEGCFFFFDLSYETQVTLQVDYLLIANQPY